MIDKCVHFDFLRLSGRARRVLLWGSGTQPTQATRQGPVQVAAYVGQAPRSTGGRFVQAP
jgi:hypothetical protein